jgi:hypothetical protein
MKKELIKLANHLDRVGSVVEANYVDAILKDNYKKAATTSGLEALYKHFTSDMKDVDALDQYFAEIEENGHSIVFSEKSPLFPGEKKSYKDILNLRYSLLKEEEKRVHALINDPLLPLKFFIAQAAIEKLDNYTLWSMISWNK